MNIWHEHSKEPIPEHIRHFCFQCGEKETKIHRQQSITYICQNADCIMFINLVKVTNWKKA